MNSDIKSLTPYTSEKMKMRKEPFISLPNACQQGSKNENINFPGTSKAKRQLHRTLYDKTNPLTTNSSQENATN